MSAQRLAILALATAIAIPAEGIRQWAYKDVAGVATICYGTTTGIKPGDYRTLAQCKALLDADMLKAIDTVQRCAKRDLSATQTAAFADAVDDGAAGDGGGDASGTRVGRQCGH